MLACGFIAASPTGAAAETRTLKVHFIHTGEKAEITFKRNGRYDADGLKKLNQFLRDWRRNEPTKMDPRLFDLVWENYRASGASGYINVVSAYRSPATNSMLRSRSKGVAEKSQHMLGKAMDFYIPGVKLKTLRDNALKLQGGGVGYYPSSGSPFIHMDVGNVRHWPGISRRELVSIFPNGKTLHVPSDGKPLPGYEQALASYKSRKASGSLSVASASAPKRSGGLLAALFGGGADEDEDTGESQVAVAAPRPKAPTKPAAAPVRAPVAVASAAAPAPKASLPGIQVIAPEYARRAELPQIAEQAPVETPETIIAALPMRSVPIPAFAPRPQADVAPAQQQLAAVIAEAPTPAVVPAAPQSIPFGAASGDPAPELAPTTAETTIAEANVPLPTWRPAYTPAAPATVAEAAAQPDTLMALASAEAPKAPTVAAPVPAARPQDMAVQAAMAAKQAPTPAPQAAPRGEELTVAALVAQQPPMAVNAPKAVVPTAAKAVATAAPKPTVAAPAESVDPVASAGAKTTRKAARPAAQDTKPDRKAVVVAAEPKGARWALSSNQAVTTVTDATTAPRFAYNIVRTAPQEVYTSGFQTSEQQAEANRFSGSAVKFLSVARFKAN
ncbi:DUF882 domain-containing protein [Corticibacterium sp. UT-5YL-CI-8]|nr:DUF882 domain-containing protein [Tianweitania sp. UT-5YL-CI-8]